jgi:predicted RNase H-like HicB family nuclease
MIFCKSKGKYKDYNIEFLKENDGRWIAECSDINGCMVYGDSKEEVTFKLIDLIKELKEYEFR